MRKFNKPVSADSRSRVQLPSVDALTGSTSDRTGITSGTDMVPERIFETSWEACNKIGGIYTVLSTKAKALQNLYKDKVVFIGPDVWSSDRACPCFKEYKTLLRNASSKLKLPYGITVRTGRWNVPGQPLAVLINFDGVYNILPEIYGKMWSDYGVDSLHAYGDYDEGCAFGIAAAIVIKALTEHLHENPLQTLAHFDEWTTAMGLLYLEFAEPRIATVFTTHATSIGRSICGNGKPLYDYFGGYHGDQMAQELNMESKHSLEKQGARHADCFTTVSSVTEAECTQLLDTTPQVVTPNGFEPNFVPSPAKYKTLRNAGRAKLLSIASALTGRTLSPDTLIVATSGRNEYRNKGIDLFIDSLETLRHDFPGQNREIAAFILVPAWAGEPQPGLKAIMEGRSNGIATESNFLTHRLNNESSDAIACRLKQLGVNKHGDKVSYIYLPCYLDGHDGILDISYYDLMPALDMTIFPSYYEPWGYTPLESIAFGVPTVSSDKAGFGQWITDHFDGTFTTCGAEVVERNDSNYHAAADSIARKTEFLALTSTDVIKKIRQAARTTSRQADWSIFIKHYQEAFAVAMRRRDQRLSNNK